MSESEMRVVEEKCDLLQDEEWELAEALQHLIRYGEFRARMSATTVEDGEGQT